MIYENPQTFVRSIKGAPASVLFALFFVRRPMTGQELQRWTGYGDDNITNAVHLLTDLGWLVAITPRGPWSLSGKSRQLPLVNFFEETESDLIGIEPTTTTYRIDSGLIVESSSKSKPSPIKSESHLNPNYAANLKACKKGGIGQPAAGLISDLVDDESGPMTPELIADHIKAAGRDNIGLAIRRLQGFELVPVKRSGPNDKVNQLRARSARRQEEENENE